MTRFAVTGGTGFIATTLIAQLLRDGHSVVTTARTIGREGELRSNLDAWGVSHTQLSMRAANLANDDGWHKAFEGCEGVFHVASPLPLGGSEAGVDIVEVARSGTLRVLNAALNAGVKRVVVTSSIAAVAYGDFSRADGNHLFTEDDWTNTDSGVDITRYEKSKTVAERAAWDFVTAHPELELATVLPSIVLGPVPASDNGVSAHLIERLLTPASKGGLPATAPIGMEVVDVRDVADLHIRAMFAPEANGERFIASTGYTTLPEIARLLRAKLPALQARMVPSATLPMWFMKLLVNRFGVFKSLQNEVGYTRKFSHDKAVQKLGWAPRSIEEAVVSCAESILAKRS